MAKYLHRMPGDTVSLGVSVSIYMPTLHLIRFSCSIHMADHRACASLSPQDSQTNQDNFSKPSFCSVMKNVNMACTPNFCSEPGLGRVSRYKKRSIFLLSSSFMFFWIPLSADYLWTIIMKIPLFLAWKKGPAFQIFKDCINPVEIYMTIKLPQKLSILSCEWSMWNCATLQWLTCKTVLQWQTYGNSMWNCATLTGIWNCHSERHMVIACETVPQWLTCKTVMQWQTWEEHVKLCCHDRHMKLYHSDRHMGRACETVPHWHVKLCCSDRHMERARKAVLHWLTYKTVLQWQTYGKSMWNCATLTGIWNCAVMTGI